MGSIVSERPRRHRRPVTPKLGKALILRQFASDFVLDYGHPVPEPGPFEVRIKTVAVGLNPVDWQAKDYNFGISSLPWVSGRDVAGIVDQVGQKVTNLTPGTAVFTLTDYTSARCGAFQDYCIAHCASVAPIPPSVTFEQAASIPVGAITAGVALKRYMGLTSLSLSRSQDWVLVWGGAACTGYYMVQLASIFGYRVISVAGKDNMDYVREAGASVVLDRERSTANLIDAIHEATSGHLNYAFDAVGAKTAAICLQAMDAGNSSEIKTLIALAGLPKEAKIAQKGGRPVELPNGSLVNVPEIKVKIFHNDADFGAQLLKQLTTYFEQGKLRVPRTMVLEGGLENVNKGLALLKNGQVSGSKLVIRVDRTSDSREDLHYHGWL